MRYPTPRARSSMSRNEQSSPAWPPPRARSTLLPHTVDVRLERCRERFIETEVGRQIALVDEVAELRRLGVVDASISQPSLDALVRIGLVDPQIADELLVRGQRRHRCSPRPVLDASD